MCVSNEDRLPRESTVRQLVGRESKKVLTRLKKFAKPKGMKQRSPLAIVFSFCVMLATTALAGEQFKESKAVVPPPPPMCDWTGFYLGLHAGGEFGHSETFDSVTDLRFGYEESGFNGGGQLGYNFQWNCLVLGAEFDAGYMNLNGSGDEPHPPVAPGFTVRGETDSDFYTTLRGRLGVAPGNGCCMRPVASSGSTTRRGSTLRWTVMISSMRETQTLTGATPSAAASSGRFSTGIGR